MKFKVGDEVVVINPNCRKYNAVYPFQGIIHQINNKNSFLNVMVKNNKSGWWWYYADDLEFSNIKVIKELMGVKNE